MGGSNGLSPVVHEGFLVEIRVKRGTTRPVFSSVGSHLTVEDPTVEDTVEDTMIVWVS